MKGDALANMLKDRRILVIIIAAVVIIAAVAAYVVLKDDGGNGGSDDPSDGLTIDNERTIRLDVGGGILLLSLLLPPLLLGAAAAAVFLHLRRRASRAAAAPQPFRDSLTAFLEEHIDDGDLSIADVAAAMNMSRSSLFQKCRDKLKMTPLEYLKELRFRKAAEMLQEGSHSISQIAWATGFNDSHYFSRAFKQRFGKTPSEYRRTAGGGS